MEIVNRAAANAIALETTLLVHGVPPGHGLPLADELREITRESGVELAIIGIVKGRPTIGLDDDELRALLTPATPKTNTANLGALLFRQQSAATTVSTTLELAALAGMRIFATGGLGGIHLNFAEHLDISSDLLALTRYPIAVVSSGVKSILDVAATREALESLGVPVIGYQTDTFPAFYLRETDLPVDARFDDLAELASFIEFELRRTGRGMLIANPIPEGDAIHETEFSQWLALAEARALARATRGRDLTPAILANLHEVSGNATLRANIALVKNNTRLASQLCRAIIG